MECAVMSGDIALAAPAARNRRRAVDCMVRLAEACVMLTLIAVPARAASRASPEQIAECKALSEHAAELIRAGQTVITTRLQLRRCVRILRAERRAGGAAGAVRN